MSRSHVSMEQKQCPVCGVTFDSGAILLNRRLSKSMESCTVTGYGMCPEHQKLYDQGYVALVEATVPTTSKSLKLNEANRTGVICHIRRPVAAIYFSLPIDNELPLIFVEPGVIEKLQQDAEENTE